GGQQDHVDAAVDHLLVSIEADELAVVLDVDLAGDLLLTTKCAETLLDAIGKGVAHGDELDVLVGVERLGGGTGAAAAAANEADFQHVAAGGMRVLRDRQLRGGDGGSGCLEKITTRRLHWPPQKKNASAKRG